MEITRLLEAWREGDNNALDALTPIVNTELRRLAHRCLRQERRNPALQFHGVSCDPPARSAVQDVCVQAGGQIQWKDEEQNS